MAAFGSQAMEVAGKFLLELQEKRALAELGTARKDVLNRLVELQQQRRESGDFESYLADFDRALELFRSTKLRTSQAQRAFSLWLDEQEPRWREQIALQAGGEAEEATLRAFFVNFGAAMENANSGEALRLLEENKRFLKPDQYAKLREQVPASIAWANVHQAIFEAQSVEDLQAIQGTLKDLDLSPQDKLKAKDNIRLRIDQLEAEREGEEREVEEGLEEQGQQVEGEVGVLLGDRLFAAAAAKLGQNRELLIQTGRGGFYRMTFDYIKGSQERFKAEDQKRYGDALALGLTTGETNYELIFYHREQGLIDQGQYESLTIALLKQQADTWPATRAMMDTVEAVEQGHIGLPEARALLEATNLPGTGANGKMGFYQDLNDAHGFYWLAEKGVKLSGHEWVLPEHLEAMHNLRVWRAKQLFDSQNDEENDRLYLEASRDLMELFRRKAAKWDGEKVEKEAQKRFAKWEEERRARERQHRPDAVMSAAQLAEEIAAFEEETGHRPNAQEMQEWLRKRGHVITETMPGRIAPREWKPLWRP